MSDATLKTARIRELNDQLRCKGIGGRVLITCGIEALGPDGARDVLTAVARFNDFSEDNDRWGEHDCAVLTVNGIALETTENVTMADIDNDGDDLKNVETLKSLCRKPRTTTTRSS